MQQKIKLAAIALAVLLTGAPAAMAEEAAGAESQVGFLTGPKAGAARDIALGYLLAQREVLGLTEADLADMVLQDQYVSSKNGVTHLVWRQRLDGVEVWNGDLNINVARDGRIINLNNLFVADLAGKVAERGPSIAPETAVERAAQALGMSLREPLQQIESLGGAAMGITLTDGGISRREIPVKLVYMPNDERTAARLAWDLSIDRVDSSDWWTLRVDATTGELLSRYNYTSHAGHGEAPEVVPADSYRVIPFPKESPSHAAHVVVTSPADANASPFGWHDTDGTNAPNFTDTRGNNVFAQDDRDNNNVAGPRPPATSGTGPLTFDYAFNPALQPNGGTNLEAAVVNLFYWNNIMHDLTYQYGFDAPGGNFQENNYGLGGLGSDPVQADAQDGSGTDNANFATPPDGFDPRMQMFEFTPPGSLVVNTPAGIAGTYLAKASSFGPALTLAGVTANVTAVNDGVIGAGTPAGTVRDGCEAMAAGSLAGQIALIDRGFCEFGVKVINAQNAGAVAVIVANNAGERILSMGPGAVGAGATISSIFVAQSTGDLLRTQLPSPGVNATVKTLTEIRRDSDFDGPIMAHEYGHGISNRLTGGPATTTCLTGAEQAGEGWSDFWALEIFAEPGDTALTQRGVGTYTSYEPDNGWGIRNFPYSTDPAVSPQTYANIATTNAPHGVGEIWAGALWNLHWELVHRYGWDPDLYYGDGGNNLLIQLVIDGMKLQGCAPTMIRARNAILLADQTNNASRNQCAIWRAFAAKGMGQNASTLTTNVGDEVQDFTVPAGCAAAIFANGFESGNTSAWSQTLP